MSEFPVDDVTLVMLAEACRINPETGQTHLHDFLQMGERIKDRSVIGDHGGIRVYEVEFEEGYEPFSEHQVILALVAEVQRLRAAA